MLRCLLSSLSIRIMKRFSHGAIGSSLSRLLTEFVGRWPRRLLNIPDARYRLTSPVFFVICVDVMGVASPPPWLHPWLTCVTLWTYKWDCAKKSGQRSAVVVTECPKLFSFLPLRYQVDIRTAIFVYANGELYLQFVCLRSRSNISRYSLRWLC